jgi:hypothetical protein
MTLLKKGGNLYVNVLMGSSKSWDDLVANIDYWLKENKHVMWLRKLQQEKVLDVGWLLFSHSNLNHRALASAASAMLGFDVYFHYRMIAVPGTTAAQLPPEQRIGAIHVQIPLDNNLAINAQLLQELYSKHNKRPFPHGVAMQLVPPRADALNFASQAKLERSRSHQAGFCDTLMHATVASFSAIDFKSTLFNKLLRDFIMEEKTMVITFSTLSVNPGKVGILFTTGRRMSAWPQCLPTVVFYPSSTTSVS